MNKKLDGRSLRKIPNTRQFNTKIREDLYQKIYHLAQAEEVLIKEIIERAINFYLANHQKKNVASADKTNKPVTKKPSTAINKSKRAVQHKSPQTTK